MADQFGEYENDVRELAKDYFAIGDSETETLMKVITSCAKTQGVVMAGVGGVAMAGVATVAVPGLGTVPGWVAGALAGFLGGTTACVIAKRTTAEMVKPILSKAGKTEDEFRTSVVAALRDRIQPLAKPNSCRGA